jgi:hypothetical protein
MRTNACERDHEVTRSRVLAEQCRDDARETDDAADGEIDAAREDDERCADGEQRIDRRLQQDVFDVSDAAKARNENLEQQDERDEDDADRITIDECADTHQQRAGRCPTLTKIRDSAGRIANGFWRLESI